MTHAKNVLTYYIKKNILLLLSNTESILHFVFILQYTILILNPPHTPPPPPPPTGNASQISDGAAAVLLARRSAARKHNLPVLGVLRGFAVTGVPPRIMGVGPAYAIPAALKNAGTSLCQFFGYFDDYN